MSLFLAKGRRVHFATVIAVFPIIFLGELPDKTMFASLVLATHGKPRSVWIGAAAAFLVHVVIATTIGVVLFRVVPHRALEAVIAGVFLAGALLAAREARRASEEREEETKLVLREAASHRQTILAAFVVVFLAEWGDLTQILTANLAARYHSPVSVATGALLALWLVAAIAVISGKSLPRLLKVATIRKVTVVVLLVLAGYSAWNAIR